MNPVWLALGATVVLVAGLCVLGWWLVADTRHHRRHIQAAETQFKANLNHPAHLLCGRTQAITVPELLGQAARQRQGPRLNWPETDPDNLDLVRPYAQDLFPTVALPRVEGD